MDLSLFLAEDEYVDFSSSIITEKAYELFHNIKTDVEKAKIAFEYVRDEIPHSFEIGAKVITARASEALANKTGICHAKANLFAALLRTQCIPTGFCFQRMTIANDDSLGYAVHCYNAIYIDYHWIKVDASGQANGKTAQFSLTEPVLAFPVGEEYDEYFWDGIYARPHSDTMKMLEKAKSLRDIRDNIPDYVNEPPDILE
ncbi:MAG: transglutaminase-like domain-containing protein [Clostridia bacterium]|nr:transglutaminase-like domain-containing protein [Clostridia bacterium]